MDQDVVTNSYAKEHVYEIERYISTFKEHSRSVVITPPFQYIKNLIVPDIFYFEVLWINDLSVKMECLKNIHHG